MGKVGLPKNGKAREICGSFCFVKALSRAICPLLSLEGKIGTSQKKGEDRGNSIAVSMSGWIPVGALSSPL